MLWILLAILTAGTIAAVVRPLLREQADAPSAPEAGDLAVYKDQLAEIEADRAGGLIGEVEAEAARAEVARRILGKAGASATVTDISASGPARPRLAYAIAALVPLAGLAAYLAAGSPTLPSLPHEARSKAPVEKASVQELLAKVEARLREKPDDGEGWDVIAPFYLRQQRYEDAAHAFSRAIALLGEHPRRLAGLGEAAIMANDGIVPEAARRAHQRLLELEPGRIDSRFWLALAKEQDGRLDDAEADFKALMEKAPADAPWRGAVEERLKAISVMRGAPHPGTGPAASSAGEAGRVPPPSDAGAMEKMSPEDRSAAVTRMVEGLAARLKADGSDLQGWLRLIRAYVVLGRTDDARRALGDARKSFEGKPDALKDIEALAADVGLRS